MKATREVRQPAEYLKKPYGRFVVPEPDGTFRAEIIEFPGCIAVGDTAAEALANLEDVAASWLEATIAKGQRVPEPIENVGFSGKLVVRLPKSLHKKAAHVAARDGVSLNQFIVSSIAEQVGAKSVGAVRRVSSGVKVYVVDPSWFPEQPRGRFFGTGTFSQHVSVSSSVARGLIMSGWESEEHA